MLAVLSALIIVHECGHFSVARLFGFQTPVFGFGLPFGPYWVLGKKWGTEFRVHACLLGGFVAIPELGDESNSEAFGLELGPFRKFPIWQRALVAFAGVGFNIIFAYLIMFMMIVNLGMPVNSTVVSGLDKAVTVATKAGVHKDDVLKSVDSVEIKSSSDLIDYLKRHRNETVNLTVLRDGKPVTMQMAPNEEGRVGLALSQETEYKKQAGVSIFEM
ncbi:MAG TPA: site-2 protease family protein, partial [Chroococcales cyanobacterium]